MRAIFSQVDCYGKIAGALRRMRHEERIAPNLSAQETTEARKAANIAYAAGVLLEIKEKDEEGLSFNQVTEELRPLIIAEKGKSVTIKPEVVLEVHYEEIQRSPSYTSGYALRFPRVISKRDDMRPDEISTLEQVEELYEMQRGR